MLLSRELLRLLLPESQGQGPARQRDIAAGPGSGGLDGEERCVGKGGLFKINGCETVGSSCLQGLCLDLGSRSGNLLLSLLKIGQGCKDREMAEQLGAKEAATVTEQSAN